MKKDLTAQGRKILESNVFRYIPTQDFQLEDIITVLYAFSSLIVTFFAVIGQNDGKVKGQGQNQKYVRFTLNPTLLCCCQLFKTIKVSRFVCFSPARMIHLKKIGSRGSFGWVVLHNPTKDKIGFKVSNMAVSDNY